jgi:hypothetical protein
MLKPVFPYKGDQIILSSERVLLHSKTDAIFLFGKEAVSLSSTKTINLDAVDKVLLDTKIIELGPKAQALGEPTVLGRSMVTQLSVLLANIEQAGNKLSVVASEDLGASMQKIREAGQLMAKESARLRVLLQSADTPVLSKVTFSR